MHKNYLHVLCIVFINMTVHLELAEGNFLLKTRPIFSMKIVENEASARLERKSLGILGDNINNRSAK